MANKILFKRGNKTELPSLNVGEPALCTDTNEVYIGNGTNLEIMTSKSKDIVNTKQFLEMLGNGCILNPRDRESLNTLLRTGKPINYGVLGDSLEVGIGNTGQGNYGESEYMWYYSANDLLALSLLKSDINFVECTQDVYPVYNIGGGALLFQLPTHQIKKSENPEIVYTLRQNQLYKQNKLTVYFMQRTNDVAGRFKLQINDGVATTVDTYTPPITLNDGTKLNVVGRLGKVTVDIPEDPTVTLKINGIDSIDRGTGIPEDPLVIICGFTLGSGLEYKNYAVSSMTLENSSPSNIQMGVTTTGQTNKLLSINPNLVVIGFGTNDSKKGYTNQMLTQYETELIALIDTIRNKKADTIIILSSAPTGATGSIYQNNYRYFEVMRKVAIQKQCSYIDVEKVIDIVNRTDVLKDDVHLNAIGYQAKAETIRKMFDLAQIPVGGATIDNLIPMGQDVSVDGISSSAANVWDTIMSLNMQRPQGKTELVMYAKIPLESAADINTNLKLFMNNVEMDYTQVVVQQTTGTRVGYGILMRRYKTAGANYYPVEVRARNYNIPAYSSGNPNRARLMAYWI